MAPGVGGREVRAPDGAVGVPSTRKSELERVSSLWMVTLLKTPWNLGSQLKVWGLSCARDVASEGHGRAAASLPGSGGSSLWGLQPQPLTLHLWPIWRIK